MLWPCLTNCFKSKQINRISRLPGKEVPVPFMTSQMTGFKPTVKATALTIEVKDEFLSLMFWFFFISLNELEIPTNECILSLLSGLKQWSV